MKGSPPKSRAGKFMKLELPRATTVSCVEEGMNWTVQTDWPSWEVIVDTCIYLVDRCSGVDQSMRESTAGKNKGKEVCWSCFQWRCVFFWLVESILKKSVVKIGENVDAFSCRPWLTSGVQVRPWWLM
jgi:hypothetical protein